LFLSEASASKRTTLSTVAAGTVIGFGGSGTAAGAAFAAVSAAGVDAVSGLSAEALGAGLGSVALLAQLEVAITTSNNMAQSFHKFIGASFEWKSRCTTARAAPTVNGQS
jgi:hypothetical protein